ncbi:MAG: BNR-4 repeat-containing protein [Prolixibacteraceae bacterium]|nr:BNR-4 repeat-containing protein [Prolixibacteraceae bacterium]
MKRDIISLILLISFTLPLFSQNDDIRRALNSSRTDLGSQDKGTLNNSKIDGYRGIWFELNQKYEFGDKYSGGLGTYTAKHIPLAVYSPEVDKTFFVYGGTTAPDARYLLCMIGEYDHSTGMVSKPTVVCDKQGVNDPHDNPSVLIDEKGYVWVFVSGRGTKRPGYKFRSINTFNIDSFIQVTEEEMTYPQPWKTRQGFFHFFTKYSGVRQLYFETSSDGINWSHDKLLAAIPENPGERSGHYQVSACFREEKLASFFNRHPDGVPDSRTDLYYIQSSDFGETWTDAAGNAISIPLQLVDSPARIVNYKAKGKNVYMKDMGFDSDGNPVCLYVISNGHKPGPENMPYQWCLTRWTGSEWETTVITESDHNYDMGSIFISDTVWRVVAPTVSGPQKWGVGGELEIWKSEDSGKTWGKMLVLTKNSSYNHSYVRRPVNYKAPFCFFWADGNPHIFSKSELYFGDFKGNIWKLPYRMTDDKQKPVKIH